MMTVEEFAQLSDTDPGDYELVNPIGKAIGEVDCHLADDTVRRPDVSIFLSNERLKRMDRTR